MKPEQQLEHAIDIARRLFGFKSFRRLDPLNVRLGKLWLSYSLRECQWHLWECGLGELPQPSCLLLDEFETAFDAMGAMVSNYASDCYEQVARVEFAESRQAAAKTSEN